MNETMRRVNKRRGEELYLELETEEGWTGRVGVADGGERNFCGERTPHDSGSCHRTPGHTGLHAWLFNWKDDHRPGSVSVIWLTERSASSD